MNLKGEKIAVCGAGGFIGGHLVQSLLADRVPAIRVVDVKPLDESFQLFGCLVNLSLDLKDKNNCLRAAARTRNSSAVPYSEEKGGLTA